MKIQKPIGYIVVSATGGGGVYKLGPPDSPERKSLWFGSVATLFSTRRSASRALVNTKKYRDAHEYNWPWIDTSYVLAVHAE
jgi:hypothetical protein